jgi:hypothetical protein
LLTIRSAVLSRQEASLTHSDRYPEASSIATIVLTQASMSPAFVVLLAALLLSGATAYPYDKHSHSKGEFTTLLCVVAASELLYGVLLFFEFWRA